MSQKNTFDDAFFEDRTITVSETGCMIWMLSTVKGDYGKTSKNGKTTLAHRESWVARNGDIPEGLVVCHRCDIPLCVNPEHLFLGAHKDNSQDMVKKGRSAKGERVSNAVLNERVVRKMREMHDDGASITDVARHFNVYKGTVRQVVLRETWRHVA